MWELFERKQGTCTEGLYVCVCIIKDWERILKTW